MTLASIPLMDRTGRRTLHLYGLGGMFIFSIFITISFLIKASLKLPKYLPTTGVHLKIDLLASKQSPCYSYKIDPKFFRNAIDLEVKHETVSTCQFSKPANEKVKTMAMPIAHCFGAFINFKENDLFSVHMYTYTNFILSISVLNVSHKTITLFGYNFGTFWA